MTPPTLEQVRRLAQELPRAERAELLAWLAQQLAAVTEERAAVDDAWAELDRMREDLAALGPAAVDSAELLSATRR